MGQRQQSPLRRVELTQPLSRALRDIAERYELGSLLSSRIITQGYDDLNVLLVCERGRYVAKFFNKTKSLSAIKGHVRLQQALARRHAPVPRILTIHGEAIYRTPGREHETLVAVSEYFAGENLTRQPPQRDDILAVTRFLATLHNLPFQVAHSYDSWGTLNLPQEFARKKAGVSDETARLVAPHAESVARLRFGRARRRIIHGDLQRTHVLKNVSGAYCILDFGCAHIGYPIVDLGVFLALFCLLDTRPADSRAVIHSVLDTYLALAPLPDRHIALLDTLIRATWASYLLSADVLIRGGDHSRQTRGWYQRALRSLRAFEGSL